jgi:hypothetical protein
MQRPLATIAGLLLAAAVGAGASQPTPSTPSQEIDREIWSVLIATVANDDIVGMGNTYFPDAVLVSPNGTAPIKATLERWGRDMAAAKARGDKATVEFRLSRRLDGPWTARR